MLPRDDPGAAVEVDPNLDTPMDEDGSALYNQTSLNIETMRDQGGSVMSEQSLYERLGGVFAIAAVVDHFSDAVVANPIVGRQSKNPALREWHTQNLGRLPGLKFMRTLWVCNVSGGPFQYTPTVPGATVLGLEEAHRRLQISPEEFDEVAAELGRTLDAVGVARREKDEVLAAFAAHKDEVTEGYRVAAATATPA